MHLPPVSATDTLTYSPARVRASIHANSSAFRAVSMAVSWRPARARTVTSGKLSLYVPYLVWATIPRPLPRVGGCYSCEEWCKVGNI